MWRRAVVPRAMVGTDLHPIPSLACVRLGNASPLRSPPGSLDGQVICLDLLNESTRGLSTLGVMIGPNPTRKNQDKPRTDGQGTQVLTTTPNIDQQNH